MLAAIITGGIGFILGVLTMIATTWLGTADSRRAVSFQFVSIAVDILRSVPEDATMPLREWAIEVINENSDVELGDSARKVLLTKQWNISVPGQKFDPVPHPAPNNPAPSLVPLPLPPGEMIPNPLPAPDEVPSPLPGSGESGGMGSRPGGAPGQEEPVSPFNLQQMR